MSLPSPAHYQCTRRYKQYSSKSDLNITMCLLVFRSLFICCFKKVPPRTAHYMLFIVVVSRRFQARSPSSNLQKERHVTFPFASLLYPSLVRNINRKHQHLHRSTQHQRTPTTNNASIHQRSDRSVQLHTVGPRTGPRQQALLCPILFQQYNKIHLQISSKQ